MHLDFEGANPDVRISGRERTEAVVSYLKGQPSEWKTALPTYAQVVYESLWPGIDLVYGSEGGKPKYTFLVAPGADPARIRMTYRGASRVEVTDAGRLSVGTPAGGFEEEAPYVYQEAEDGARVPVAGAYALEPTSPEGAFGFGFRLGPYDGTRPLVLDPTVLVYCGYIGGSGNDQGTGIAVNASGDVYIVGQTSSGNPPGYSPPFPVTAGAFDTTYNGAGGFSWGDAFVAKVRADGTGLVWATYIGGSQDDRGLALALAADGSVFLTGDTASSEAQGFPLIGGPDLSYNGATDGFVAKLNPTGTALVYCGYIGGSAADRGWKIASDASGYAYVAGMTSSDQTTFPETTGAYDTTWNGGQDGFVAKVASDGSSLVYATYLGSPGLDSMGGIALDATGNTYLTGSTDSSSFPTTTGPAHGSPGTAADAFVAKLNPTGSGLVYSRFLGGSSVDFAQGLAIDTAGNAYVTGQTRSGNFPRTVLQSYQGGYDVFVTKVNAAGSALTYSGYIGGAQDDQGFAIAVDGTGNAYVTGQVSSSESQAFPVTDGPDLSFNGSTDAFVAKVNSAGTALVYCGYVGGTVDEYGSAIAVDATGQAYVTGYADSTEAQGFPVTVGPDLTHNSVTDAFVVKIAGAALALGDHPLGQIGDQFTTTNPVLNAVLFRFKLTAAATVTVDTLRVRFTTTGGVANGDVTGGELYVDVNGNGVWDGGDTLVQGSVAPVGGVLTFTTNFAPATSPGTSYLVRASVANLVAGDTTTFSVAAADIDEVELGVAEPGAISDAYHVQDYASGGDIYYSVGTSTADLKTGAPWITISNGVATLDASQTGNVGVGDVITYNFSGSKAYVRAVLSPTRFVVQTVTGGLPANHGGSNVNSIMRVFNDIATAVSQSGTASYLGNTNLSGNNRKLTWVCYNDRPFNVSVNTTISGYTTDATRFVTLTVAGPSQVASGVSQRHSGLAGTGAVLRAQAGSMASSAILLIAQAYTVLEWLEVDGASYVNQNGVSVSAASTGALLRNLVVHDIGTNSAVNCPSASNTCTGIVVSANSAQVRNTFVYDYGQDGILSSGTGVTIANTTIFRTRQTGQGLQLDRRHDHRAERPGPREQPRFLRAGLLWRHPQRQQLHLLGCHRGRLRRIRQPGEPLRRRPARFRRVGLRRPAPPARLRCPQHRDGSVGELLRRHRRADRGRRAPPGTSEPTRRPRSPRRSSRSSPAPTPGTSDATTAPSTSASSLTS